MIDMYAHCEQCAYYNVEEDIAVCNFFNFIIEDKSPLCTVYKKGGELK